MTVHAPDPTHAPQTPAPDAESVGLAHVTVPVTGADVIPGDRLVTPHGLSAEITHLVTQPPNSFAAAMWGEGVRIPYHGSQAIAWPLPPTAEVTVQRAA